MLPSDISTIAVEAGVRQGWTGFGVRGALGLDRFGASAPGAIVAEKLGLHVKGNCRASIEKYVTIGQPIPPSTCPQNLPNPTVKNRLPVKSGLLVLESVQVEVVLHQSRKQSWKMKP